MRIFSCACFDVQKNMHIFCRAMRNSTKHTPDIHLAGKQGIIVQVVQYELPPTGFIRLKQVLELIPVSKSTWWAGVASGIYPNPRHLSERTTAWRIEDIVKLIKELGGVQ